MAKKTAARKTSAARTSAAPKRAVKAAARSKKAAARKGPARTAAPARKPGKRPAKKAAKKVVKKIVKKIVKKVVAAPARKSAKKAVKKVVAARKAAPKKAVARRPVAKKAPARKPAPPPVALRTPAPKPAAKAPAARKATPARHLPALDRERRTVNEGTPSSLVSNRHASAASSGADELRVRLASHTGTGPAITAGDVDANWEAAETVGDEAPGGDNPTPDQDVVDEIGKALGVEYDDDEELQGGDEIAARDHDRWELDPASSDDFDER
jgi:hypothetical protein